VAQRHVIVERSEESGSFANAQDEAALFNAQFVDENVFLIK